MQDAFGKHVSNPALTKLPVCVDSIATVCCFECSPPTHTHAHTHTHTHIHTHTYTYTHTYIHTYIHTYTHTIKATLFEDYTLGGPLCQIMATAFRVKTEQSWYVSSEKLHIKGIYPSGAVSTSTLQLVWTGD